MLKDKGVGGFFFGGGCLFVVVFFFGFFCYFFFFELLNILHALAIPMVCTKISKILNQKIYISLKRADIFREDIRSHLTGVYIEKMKALSQIIKIRQRHSLTVFVILKYSLMGKKSSWNRSTKISEFVSVISILFLSKY